MEDEGGFRALSILSVQRSKVMISHLEEAKNKNEDISYFCLKKLPLAFCRRIYTFIKSVKNRPKYIYRLLFVNSLYVLQHITFRWEYVFVPRRSLLRANQISHMEEECRDYLVIQLCEPLFL